MSELLNVKKLHVEFETSKNRYFKAVRGVDIQVNKNETIGIVGESGSGKSVTATSVMGLLPNNARVTAEDISFKGKSIYGLSQREYQKLRGTSLSMIFQDPMTTLNPVFTIGNQLIETILAHQKIPKREAKKLAIDILEQVGIVEAKNKMNMYPHEFSGGMRQRVMIAIAVVCEPDLIIADEPTTALDVTIQAQILNLLKKLQHESETSIIMITHDLGVVWEMCDRVYVMFKGRVLEVGTALQIYDNPQHPYTKGLLASTLNKKDNHGEKLPTIKSDALVKELNNGEELELIEVEPGHFVAPFHESMKRTIVQGGKNE